ncbi:formate dehydrogenase accessory sulfurtransferase FdhD [Marinomonas sp. A79]|uniref:Sulfur carrier protein FdhD n=1 Tax=Marinomonas vulgaris TaxID=2823372 RepID=A0ABS5HCH6_9GAMM|nr:formate dehydrogenase accessory sulfurtransferase FdhD [Marinomonas vulgaris]MBR7889172.1 formate dehydrogenase accessory sulfurtransferase FdhD [Marinomonas vulgaris]
MWHLPFSFSSHGAYAFDRIGGEQGCADLVEETPLAISINGIAHAVMMVTPLHLEAFVLGFARSEGLITQLDNVRDMEIEESSSAMGVQSLAINLVISPRQFARFKQRKHTHLGASGCGLCGVESIAAAVPELEQLAPCRPLQDALLTQLRRQFHQHQTLGNQTGAVHGALLLSPAGDAIICMEDIGRHNALDKILGYALQQGINLHNHSVLMSSRCSTELVQKAVRVGLSRLIHLASPSTLAVKLARHYGLTLIHLPKQDAPRVFASSQQSEGTNHE